MHNPIIKIVGMCSEWSRWKNIGFAREQRRALTHTAEQLYAEEATWHAAAVKPHKMGDT
jgi:hypothetical protein